MYWYPRHPKSSLDFFCRAVPQTTVQEIHDTFSPIAFPSSGCIGILVMKALVELPRVKTYHLQACVHWEYPSKDTTG